MRFEFAFETLLDHKRTLEDVARKEWAEAQRNVDSALAELNRFYQQIDESRARAGELGSTGGQSAPELIMIDEFIAGQKIRIESQRKKVRELMGIAESKQDVLVEAAKERKTLEKLKERQYEEYRQMRKKLDLKRVDELVVTRFGKDILGGSKPE